MIWKDLPAGPFDVILADPPWSYHGAQDKWTAAAKFYATASNNDLYELPVPDLLSKRGIIFLWTTSPRLDTAIECLHRWGLAYRGVAFAWVKCRKDGKPIGAQGIRPSIVKPTAEYVIAGSRVGKGRPLPLEDESIPNIILAPRLEHSQKPEAVQDYIERMYPAAVKLEMFARRERDGWTAWGNETGKLPARTGGTGER